MGTRNWWQNCHSGEKSKRRAHCNVGAATGLSGRRASFTRNEASILKSTALNLSLTSRRPVKKEEIPLVRGRTLGAARPLVFRFSNTLGKKRREKAPKMN